MPATFTSAGHYCPSRFKRKQQSSGINLPNAIMNAVYASIQGLGSQINAKHIKAELSMSRCILSTDNASTATQLRFHSKHIEQELLRTHGIRLRSLTVKMAASASISTKLAVMEHKAKPRLMSSRAAEIIQQTASMVEDNELSAALKKLAKRAS